MASEQSMDCELPARPRMKSTITLTDVAVEIQREVVHWVSKQPNLIYRRDGLRNLCLTSKRLFELASPCLHAFASVGASSRPPLLPLSFSKDDESLQHLRELHVTRSQKSLEDDVQSDADIGSHVVEQDAPGPADAQASFSALEALGLPTPLEGSATPSILEALTPNTILRFRYVMHFPLYPLANVPSSHLPMLRVDIQALAYLFETQRGLRSLDIHSLVVPKHVDASKSPLFATYPTDLEELELTIGDWTGTSPTTTINTALDLSKHCHHLRTLYIWDWAETFETEDCLTLFGQPVSLLCTTMPLVNLTLEGVSFDRALEESASRYPFDISSLKTLRLRSCLYADDLLEGLIGAPTQLHNLEVGCENDDEYLVPALRRFLKSFSGLSRLVYVTVAKS